MYQIVRVALDKATVQYDKLYDYILPQGMHAVAGCRVTVPFGAGNKRRLALVMEAYPREDAKGLKAVVSVVDEAPLLGAEQLALVAHMKADLFANYFDAVRLLIPPGYGMRLEEGYALAAKEDETPPEDETELQIINYLKTQKKPQNEKTICDVLGIVGGHKAFKILVENGRICPVILDKQKTQDERITMVKLADNFYEVCENSAPKFTKKQAEVIKLLEDIGTASIKEVTYFCALTRAVVDKLEKSGFVEYYAQKVYKNIYKNKAETQFKEPQLSALQQTAYESLVKIHGGEGAKVTLLHGVTGSGKTQLFLKLARLVVASGKKVVVMVPEISLTNQTIDVFYGMFGGRVAVLHSSLSMGERISEWRRIKNGEADVVVGTRSAVFAPLENIGLVVIDEEQESTYKSESSPRYHTRDIAKWRCHFGGAHLLLCSATPSVESYYNAKQGKYNLITLSERYVGAKLPDVYMLDMRLEPAATHTTAISGRLAEELYYNLQKGEQSILLLNRRGYNTVVKCSSCGEVSYCPNCSVPLTYHQINGSLICHYCQHTQKVENTCTKCGSKVMRFSGVGTQRVEEQLHQLFGDAKILRMDMDTTQSRYSFETKFNDFYNQKYDIMLGTQMVAKGLNFPNVTLVGVLGADSMLYSEDFRNLERTFALITQVIGRAGRAELPGRAFIQTTDPDHKTFKQAAAQDYTAFYNDEIGFRKLGIYPPFCDMVEIGFVGTSEKNVMKSAQNFAKKFSALAKESYNDLPIRLLGPSMADTYKVAGKYRYKIIVKCRWNKKQREMLLKLYEDYFKDKNNKDVTMFIDKYYNNSF